MTNNTPPQRKFLYFTKTNYSLFTLAQFFNSITQTYSL